MGDIKDILDILQNDVSLYFITDRKKTKRTVLEDVGAALDAGVKIVQYREKNGDSYTLEMVDEARIIKKMCDDNGALFIVNDYVGLAKEVGADGVHLGQDDMPYEKAREILGDDKIIGISTHSLEQAIKAEEDGADYIGVGPLYNTDTKNDVMDPIGPEIIKEVYEKVKIPFVAIGGINEENIREVLDYGARKVAMISEIVAKEDVNVKEQCKKHIRIIENAT